MIQVDVRETERFLRETEGGMLAVPAGYAATRKQTDATKAIVAAVEAFINISRISPKGDDL